MGAQVGQRRVQPRLIVQDVGPAKTFAAASTVGLLIGLLDVLAISVSVIKDAARWVCVDLLRHGSLRLRLCVA